MQSSILLIKKKRQPKTRLFMLVLIVTLAMMVANQILVNIQAKQMQANNQHISDLGTYAQAISRQAADVLSGDSSALPVLGQTSDNFANTWELVKAGSGSFVNTGIGFKAALPGNGELVEGNFPGLDEVWSNLKSDTDLILNNQALLTEIQLQGQNLSSILPLVQREYVSVFENLQGGNQSLANQITAQRQGWLTERLAYNLERIFTGSASSALADSFQQDLENFMANHQALLDGSSSQGISRLAAGASRESLLNVSSLMAGIQDAANVIITAMTEMEVLATAEARIQLNAELITEQMGELALLLSAGRGIQLASPLTGYLLLLIMLLNFISYGRQVLRQSQEAEQVSTEKNSRNNEAVLKLLSEISSLGEGDLTVKATVGKDFTGAIADAINYAVEQLRDLVAAITSVTMEVTSSTEASRETVASLSQASKRQTESITSVHKSIREIGDGINQVNENAQKTLDVAKNSVKTAIGGARVVKDTIKGMGNIREQIQDTSKRIKRLGESSQEIGGFVSLINDIAEHTNTLSLNAAIQAATAGDAGKGFAVVADEVHALAERSADATRQIESLVKVIQGDITEAVKSMEETTVEVVSGTRLAQSAGEALDDIQKVSRELQELVDSINEASSNQSKAASEISSSMDVIQQMTANTTNGVEQTTEFMSNLGALTERLQSAVAGFSLEEKKTNKWSKFSADQSETPPQDKTQKQNPQPAVSNLKLQNRDDTTKEDELLISSAQAMSA